VVVAMPRGGSTWLMEVICSQPGFRYVSEPFSMRNPRVSGHLGFTDWADLYQRSSQERVRAYLSDLASGRVTFMNPAFTRRFYRPFTNRTVFKLIHGGEDQIAWMTGALDAEVIVLLRHPIAVTLSRQQLPRLSAFVHSDYRLHFDDAQLALARRILDGGTKLEQGVLSWCFQASVPLRTEVPRVSVLTYEQLVLEPETVVPWLAETIRATRPERMRRQIRVPSATVDQSFEGSRGAVEDANRSYLVEKWRKSVDAEEERRLMAILEAFGLDAYRAGEATSERYWLRPASPSGPSSVR
jgi:hypothetical protein